MSVATFGGGGSDEGDWWADVALLGGPFGRGRLDHCSDVGFRPDQAVSTSEGRLRVHPSVAAIADAPGADAVRDATRPSPVT